MLKQLKSFFTKIRATIPLTEVPLARPKSLTKEGGVLFFDRRKNVSTQKLKLFFTRAFYIPTWCTRRMEHPHTHN